MKNIFIIPSFFIFLFVLYINFPFNQKKTTEVILSVDNMNSTQVLKSIKEDFNNFKGIRFIDASLVTETIIFEVKNDNIDISNIDNILSKWGCTMKDIDYKILK